MKCITEDPTHVIREGAGPMRLRWEPKALVFCCIVGLLAGTASAQAPEVSVALHDSPWLPAFRQLAEAYTKETGARIKLNVFPYQGLYEKETAAMTAQSGEFDITFLDDAWTPFFYGAGYMTPLQNVDPGFKLDPAIIEYAYADRWNAAKKNTTKDGTLLGLPINGNLQLFYYRKDWYRQAGVGAPPDTWDDVVKVAQKLHAPGKIIGFVTGGQKGSGSIVLSWLPFLRSYRGDVFANPPTDWTITLGSDAAKKSLRLYLELMQRYGPSGPGDFGQSDVLASLATGKAAQGLSVAAIYPYMDDPKYSTAPYSVDMSVIPRPRDGVHATTILIWMMGIPKSSKNKRAALEFMRWATSKDAQVKYTEFGAVPVRRDVYESALARQGKFRYMRAMTESAAVARERPRIPDWFQVEEIMGTYLNEALIGQLSPDTALSRMTTEIYRVLKAKGYAVKLP